MSRATKIRVAELINFWTGAIGMLATLGLIVTSVAGLLPWYFAAIWFWGGGGVVVLLIKAVEGRLREPATLEEALSDLRDVSPTMSPVEALQDQLGATDE